MSRIAKITFPELIQGVNVNSSTNINILDLSGFANLQYLTGTSTINEIRGLENNTKLINFTVTGSSCHTSIRDINIPNKPNLKFFEYENNQVTGTIGNINIPGLIRFRVFGNQISGALPILSTNTGLQYFQIQDNNLTGPITSNYLANNNELLLFQVYNNKISGQIPNISNLKKLAYFQANNNNLNGIIDENFASNNSNLIYLQARSNELLGKLPKITGMENLKYFQFEENQLTGILDNYYFSNNRNLYFFNITGNRLSGSIPNLNQATGLNLYGVANNSFTGFQGLPLSGWIFSGSNLNNISPAVSPYGYYFPGYVKTGAGVAQPEFFENPVASSTTGALFYGNISIGLASSYNGYFVGSIPTGEMSRRNAPLPEEGAVNFILQGQNNIFKTGALDGILFSLSGSARAYNITNSYVDLTGINTEKPGVLGKRARLYLLTRGWSVFVNT